MNSNDYWQQFVVCGTVSAYLKYKEEKVKETCKDNDTKSVYN